MEEKYFSDLEKEYFNRHNTWKLEESLLFSFSKDDLKSFIKSIERSYLEANIEYYETLCKKQLVTLYVPLNELDKYFIEQVEFEFHGGRELDQNKQFLDRLKRFYKTNYEIDTQYKKSVDINSISIKEVISMYARIPNNIRRNIRCILPDHKDKSASFRIYENSNSYYCFGCHKGGNIINFVSEMENITTKQAYKKVQKLFG